MKYDIYVTEGKVKVYHQAYIPPCGEIPDKIPLFVCDTVEDAWDWCDQHKMDYGHDAFRVNRLGHSVSLEYINDLKTKAQERLDRYRKEGKSLGWGELEIDHNGMNYTYRSSAAWKDEPIRYTFEQPLKWSKKSRDVSDDGLRVSDTLLVLWGMSVAVYELGLSLVFDKDFKVHVMGTSPRWISKYEN